MQKIQFNKTNQIFLDNGIIALYRYLKLYEQRGTCMLDLQPQYLEVAAEHLPKLLENVYYEMGKDIYDTYTSKQEAEPGNLYYIEEEDRFEAFPKIKTYGFTELLTNDAQGVTRNEENTTKIEKLGQENPALAAKIRTEFERRNLKLLSKVYLNEPYTKITRLEPLQEAHLLPGKEQCYLTGAALKKLVIAQNTNPFFSGILNFNSNLSGNDKKISWQALYLSRFAAANCLYAYSSKVFDAINVFFFGTSTLTDLNLLCEDYLNPGIGIKYIRDKWKETGFVQNFELYQFGKEKEPDGYTGKHEYLFMILYTIFRKIIAPIEAKKDTTDDEDYLTLMGETIHNADFLKVSPFMASLRADSFASTKRPNDFETITHLKYIMQLFFYFEREKLNVLEVLWSLKILKPSLRGKTESYNMERARRNVILGKILKMDSILSDVESIFYDSFRYLISKESVGYKNYDQLLQLIQLYETKINRIMDKDLQLRAIKLGQSIAIGIERYEGGTNKLTNIKQGRSYIISLRKARTLNQFLSEISRMQARFGIIVASDILMEINEQNVETIRHFVIIGALNSLNIMLSSQK